MAIVKFENGVTVNFDGDPTSADIEEVAASFSPRRKFNTIAEAQSAMKQSQGDLQRAQLQASPIGLAGQVLGGAANAITGGGISKLEDIMAQKFNAPRFANKQSPAYNVGAGAGNIAVGAALSPVGGGLPGQIAAQTLGGAYSNPDNRLMGAALSGGGTAAFGVAGKVLPAVGKAVRRVNASFKGPSSNDLQAGIDKRILEIDDSKKALETLLSNKKKSLEQLGKKEVPRISADMSAAYGKALNGILDKLEDPLTMGSVLKKDALPITNQEMIDVLKPVVERAAKDPLINKGPAFTKAAKMLDFYENGMKNSAGLVDGSTGRLLSTSAPEYADVKTIISQIRDVRSTMNPGDSPISGKDYFATQFDVAISKLLKSRVNGFSELQQSYGPIANTRKVAYKIFKPLSDESGVDAFMRRIQNDSLKSSDIKLIKFLEDGGEVGGLKIEGAGKFSGEIKDLGMKLKELKSGREVKGLKSQLSQKAADEKFRNRLFTWVAVSTGVGGGLLKAKDFINR